MKVALVTPYYKESIDVLRRNHESVMAQTYPGVTHIMVADGHPNETVTEWDCEHIALPGSHRDGGGTPRAIGALSAFGRGYDAVGFLDADNWIDPDHVACMVAVVESEGADFVAATRRIHCGNTLEFLYTDLVESNGDYLTDTNCMFLTRACAHLLGYWSPGPEKAMISDRVFWDAVKHSGLRIARCLKPTVSFPTRYAFHYGYAGVEIPPEAVWFTFANTERTVVRYDNDAMIRHGDLTPEQQEEALRGAIAGLPANPGL
jgi:glycosyltransferase involved in cell wall biosynthesis